MFHFVTMVIQYSGERRVCLLIDKILVQRCIKSQEMEKNSRVITQISKSQLPPPEEMALVGFSGLVGPALGLGGWTDLGGLGSPLAFGYRDGPFLFGDGAHWVNGLCKKKRSAEAEAYYGYGGYGLIYTGYGYGGYGYGKRSADSEPFGKKKKDKPTPLKDAKNFLKWAKVIYWG